jgi:phosphoglucomutase
LFAGGVIDAEKDKAELNRLRKWSRRLVQMKQLSLCRSVGLVSCPNIQLSNPERHGYAHQMVEKKIVTRLSKTQYQCKIAVEKLHNACAAVTALCLDAVGALAL